MNLRAALVLSLAALAAAPSHAAVTELTIPDFNVAQGYVTAGTSNGTTKSVYVELTTAQTWNTSWSVVVSAKGSTLTGNLTLMGLYMTRTGAASGVSEGATMTGGNLNFTTWSAWPAGDTSHQSSGINFTQYENVTLVMSRDKNNGGALTLTAYDSSDFSTALFKWAQADQTFSDYNLNGFVLGALGTHTKLNNSGNNVAFAADSAVGAYSVTKAGFSSGSVASATDLTNYYIGNTKNLTWNGNSSGEWDGAVWIDGDGNPQSFSSKDSVTFATDGAHVTLIGATAANGMAIEENTTIELSGNTLKASGLTVANGKTFTLTGEGSAMIGDVSGGSANVNGSNLTVANAISNTTLTVTNGGSVSAFSLSGGSANVDGSSLTVANAISNTTLAVTNGGSVSAFSLSGGSANVDGSSSNLTVANAISNTTLTIGNSGSASCNSISGSTATVLANSTLSLTGTTLADTTVEGALTLTSKSRVNLTGNVTLGSVKNDRDKGDTYAFVGDNANVTLKFTGETDLTKKETNTHSSIGLKQGKLIVAKGASLTMGKLYYNSNNNAKVEADGKLVMQASDQNQMHYLKVGATGDVVSGSENAKVNLIVLNQVEVADEIVDGVVTKSGKLKANILQIKNTDNTQTKLGGEVDVASLQLDHGTAVISGKVTADKVTNTADAKTGEYVGSDEGKGTLTIEGTTADATCGSTLSGNFTVVKQGTNKQTFNGSGNRNFAGSLTVEGGTLDLTKIRDTVLLNLKDISISNGSTLGLYTSDAANAASLATISADKLTSGAVAATRSAGANTLNANIVMDSESTLVLDSPLAVGGTLTLNGTTFSESCKLFRSLYQGVTSITLFTGVTSLTIGSGESILPNSLTETNEDGTLYHPFSDTELAAAFDNGFDPNVFHVSYIQESGATSGTIVMTANVPEPGTAVLSLVALAGLCARRRRK